VALIGIGSAVATAAQSAITATAPTAVLSPCTGLPDLPTARCGSITVDLDRAHPDRGTTTVAFALIPHTDQTQPALGTIVTNPGGPGDSDIDLAGALYAQGLAPALDRRDLLLIDPRGTGRSGPISCPALADPTRAFASVDTQRALIGACGRQLGDGARDYTTAATADDFDDVRAALGIDRLDLLGDSYGTFLMATYAQRHPNHVQSVVLSGAYAVNIDPSGAQDAAGLRRAIGLVCTRTNSCSGRTVLADLAALATRLRAHPSTVDVQYAQKTYPVVLDEWQLAGTVGKIYSGQPDTDTELALAQAAAAARTGDLEPIRALVRAHLLELAAIYAAGAQLYSDTLNWAATCHDYPHTFDLADSVADRTRDYDRSVSTQDPKDFAPFSALAWSTRDSYDRGACLDWRHDPTARTPFRPGAAMPNVPVLVLSGDLDANTPGSAGRAAADQFPNARWVEVPNAGHTPSETAAGLKLITDFFHQHG
jgi:pimeloyl-ACP methyl ester carboxylesterase